MIAGSSIGWGERMSGRSRDGVLLKIVGPLFGAAVGSLLGWLPSGLGGAIGSPSTILLGVIGGMSGLTFSLMFRRYVGVLGSGGGRKGSLARDSYDRLRESLSGGNLASRLCSDWLARFLDEVDRFFGDASMTDRTLLTHAFGLKTSVPLWTACAFDRCLSLALIYPIAAIFVIWVVSGYVGPAEIPLGLQAYTAAWRRELAVGLVGFSIPLFHRSLTFIIWQAAIAVSLVAGVAAGVVAIAFAVAFSRAIAGAGAVAIAFAGAVTFAVAFADAGAFAGACVVAGAFVVAGAVTISNDLAVQNHRQGVFLLLFLFAAIIVCLGAATLLSRFETWVLIGPLLLFLGLLTLLNAPFDWVSLGLTRALLRRGLELGGWWPYLLVSADGLVAAAIVAPLSIAMVIGAQAFDHLAEFGGGPEKRVLPLAPLLDGIAANPWAPEYWWVYALLLSTMIPSVISLMIGGASLFRGIPGLAALLLRVIPADKAAMPMFDRAWLALVLTCQVFAGAFLGIASQSVLAIGVISYVLPWLGFGLLDTAREVAAFDLPTHLLRLWWSSLP
jgi:hypothetical protein